jgi:hypothetical protein
MGVLFHNQVREESPTIRELSCRKNAWGGHIYGQRHLSMPVGR